MEKQEVSVTNGIVLPPGYDVHVRRTDQPTRIYKFLGNKKFEDSAGTIFDQQEVFGQTFDRVAVINPSTGQITTY